MIDFLKITRTPTNQVFFWSDLHLCHAKDFILNPRGFTDVNHAKEETGKRWRTKITNDDTVFLLGDNVVGAGNYGVEELTSFLHTVPFKEVYMMPGNHPSGFKQLFESWFVGNYQPNINLTFRVDLTNEKTIYLIPNYFELCINHQLIVMSHYPQLSWNKMGKGTWMLYGHVHDNLKKTPWIRDNYFKGKNLDLGIEATPHPLEFEEIQRIMNSKEILKVDHHDKATT